jgi:hypothetical protein
MSSIRKIKPADLAVLADANCVAEFDISAETFGVGSQAERRDETKRGLENHDLGIVCGFFLEGMHA